MKQEKVVCRKYFKITSKDNDGKSKHLNINKNFEYVINKFNDKTMILEDESTKEHITVTLDVIKHNFIHAYCNLKSKIKLSFYT